VRNQHSGLPVAHRVDEAGAPLAATAVPHVHFDDGEAQLLGEDRPTRAPRTAGRPSSRPAEAAERTRRPSSVRPQARASSAARYGLVADLERRRARPRGRTRRQPVDAVAAQAATKATVGRSALAAVGR
jgi:hypothetical protein